MSNIKLNYFISRTVDNKFYKIDFNKTLDVVYESDLDLSINIFPTYHITFINKYNFTIKCMATCELSDIIKDLYDNLPFEKISITKKDMFTILCKTNICYLDFILGLNRYISNYFRKQFLIHTVTDIDYFKVASQNDILLDARANNSLFGIQRVNYNYSINKIDIRKEPRVNGVNENEYINLFLLVDIVYEKFDLTIEDVEQTKKEIEDIDDEIDALKEEIRELEAEKRDKQKIISYFYN